jgi:hypothetical protein
MKMFKTVSDTKKIALVAIMAIITLTMIACGDEGDPDDSDIKPGKLIIQNLPSDVNPSIYVYDYAGTITNNTEAMDVYYKSTLLAMGGSRDSGNTFNLNGPNSTGDVFSSLNPPFDKSGTFAIFVLWYYNQNARYFQKVSFTNGGAIINYNNASFKAGSN